MKAPGRDPGGIIAYEYEQRMRPYLNEKTWIFQEDIPHVSESFTLELPSGYTYGTVWAHHNSVQAADLEHQRWRWEMKDTPGIDLDHVPDAAVCAGAGRPYDHPLWAGGFRRRGRGYMAEHW